MQCVSCGKFFLWGKYFEIVTCVEIFAASVGGRGL
jgi:hypothetical protein